ncbi:MAG: CoA transferase [Proteobacteria bacterium]|nr:CoA transferase [Pseudomonadota bacterium]
MQRFDARESHGPCAGFRVLDFTNTVSGPMCSQYLGDLGADVVKVEPPDPGDASRATGQPFPDGMTGLFLQLNRNKRSIVIDLRNERGREVARRLARGSDVVVTNYRPGVAERIGIGYERLSEENPRLVYVAITGFGPDGPYAHLPAYDHLIQGLSGMMPVQGAGGPPKMMQSVVVDKCSGLVGGGAALAALLARERNGGLGQRVDVPMLDAYAAYMAPELLSPHAFPQEKPQRSPTGQVFRTWETRDGFVVGIAVLDAQFAALCRALEREDLLEVERFARMSERFRHVGELYPILETEFRKWSTDEIVERARRFGAPFGPVHAFEDFLADPQVAHNRTVFEAPGPGGDPARYLTHPARFSRSPAGMRRAPPRLAEHSDEILREAGYSGEEIEALRGAGAIA